MSVTHKHGQHEPHVHTDDEYEGHQVMANEEIIAARVEVPRANLGLATTREMLEELIARGEMLGRKDEFAVDMVREARLGLDALPERILAYRTADEAVKRMPPGSVTTTPPGSVTTTAVSPERQAKREAGA